MRTEQLFPKRLPAAHWRNIAAGILLAGVSTFASPPAGADPGTTERVSVSSGGKQGNGSSFLPSISADGRFVGFRSDSTNLVPGDTRAGGLLVHDRQTGITERVSVSSAGNQGNFGSGRSDAPSLSAAGRFVAFSSGANNLVPDDTMGPLTCSFMIEGPRPKPRRRLAMSEAPGQVTLLSEAVRVYRRAAPVALGLAFLSCSLSPLILRGSEASTPAEPDSAFDYAQAFIQGLSWAHQAASREVQPGMRVTKAATDLKTAAFEFEKAGARVKPFIVHRNTTIAQSARVAQETYVTLARLSRDIATGFLAQPASISERRQWEERMTGLIAAREQALERIPSWVVGVAEVLLQLPEGPNAPKIGNRLWLTKVQRTVLLQDLLRSFGTDIKGGAKEGHSFTLGAGAFLYGFISNSDVKARDE